MRTTVNLLLPHPVHLQIFSHKVGCLWKHKRLYYWWSPNYWIGQNVHLVFLQNKTHFSFSPITLLIWVFWACLLSSALYNIDCPQLMPWFGHCHLNWSTWSWSMVQQKVSSTKLRKPLLTRDQSQHLLHALHRSVLLSSRIFTFLEIIKHNMLTVLRIFFIFDVKMDTQIHQFW